VTIDWSKDKLFSPPLKVAPSKLATVRELHGGHHLATTTPIGGIQAGLAA
jgi:hypothetical protein